MQGGILEVISVCYCLANHLLEGFEDSFTFEGFDDPSLDPGCLTPFFHAWAVFSRQHDDIDRLIIQLPPDFLDHRQTIHIGHIDVTDNQFDTWISF